MDSGYQKIDKKSSRWSAWALIVMASVAFTACGGGGGGGDGSGDDAASAENRDYPGSIVGERIEFTVTEAGQNSVQEGLTVVYDFSSDGQVQGTNPETGQVLTPVSYEYTPEGRNASIRLYYEYDNGGAGYEDYDLVAGDSILQGTYDYEAVVTSGGCCGGGAKGNYRIIPPNNASFYQAENAAELTEEAASILQQMTRRNDIAVVSMGGSRDAYVAVDANGGLFADTSLKERRVFRDGMLQPEETVTLPYPPEGTFSETALDSAGVPTATALDDDGQYWFWSGDANYDPRIDQTLPSPVHSIVGNSGGELVIAGEDRRPFYACLTPNAGCDSAPQSELDNLEIADVDQAAVVGRTLLYTDMANRVLQFADLDSSSTGTLIKIPAGLDPLAQFILGRFPFVVAITINGEVVAWDYDGNYLDVPAEADSGAIDVSAGINPASGPGERKYDVAVVRDDGIGVVWTYNWNNQSVEDVRTPEEGRNAKGVVVTSYPGHILFLEKTGG
ncbi:hypothetical protein ACJO5Y_19815 [Marinobacter sp. GN3S48]|uniref:hypothetical protein n=1 Tax=Marinobacter sp. GN3S48 TaxID=3382302 RepID=UPI00387B90E6